MTEKETYVRPHKRRNKKKDGKHHVKGHSRELPSKKGTVESIPETRETMMGGTDFDEHKIKSGERVVLNEKDFSNPRLMIDVGKKPGYDNCLTVRTPDGDEIKRIPGKVRSIVGGNYQTDKKGDNRFWRYTPEAPQDIEYYLKNFMRSDKYRVTEYHVPENWEGTEWKMEVEKVD